MVVGLDAVAVDHIIAGIDGAPGDDTGGCRIRKGRLEGLGRIDHIDHCVSLESKSLGCDNPDVVASEFPADTASHFKFYHGFRYIRYISEYS